MELLLAHDDGGGCCQNPAVSASTTQSLSELDFERGIWGAALENDCGRARDLIRKNPDCVRDIDSSGYTGLHYASRAGHTEMMRILLDAGADPDARTGAGKVTPLHRAAYMGHLEAVQLLIGQFEPVSQWIFVDFMSNF